MEVGSPQLLRWRWQPQVPEEGEGDIPISLKKVKVLYHTLYYCSVVQYKTFTMYSGRSYSIVYSVA